MFSRDPILAIRRLISYFRPPLISFQMGKVGSRTIQNTIQTDCMVHHLHTKQEMLLLLPRIKKKVQGEIDIITATREPVGREVSVYFQNFLSPGYPHGVPSAEFATELGASGLAELFKKRWREGMIDTTVWFDHHFLTSTGIDVYDHPFDPEKGWTIIRSNGFRVLIVRFEDIRKNYLEAINGFMGGRAENPREYSRMWPNNVSGKKWYGELMKEFKSTVRFTKQELDDVYESKYCAHFYTKDEVRNMRSRWRVGE
jgi:hypothetical protein